MNTQRIFIGPVEITGQYRNLALAIKDGGNCCDYYTFYSHPFDYGGDLGPSKLPYLMRRIHRFGFSGGLFRRLVSILIFEIFRICFFIMALLRYDKFIFGFGLSLLRFNLDLPILYLFGKTIVANISHGSDMTPAYVNGALMDSNAKMPPVDKLIKETRRTKKVVRRFERYADYIIGSPLSSSFLAAKPFINIFSVGRVCQASAAAIGSCSVSNVEHKKDEKNSKDLLRIIHAPSQASGKGSKEIKAVIDRLAEKGFDIDFRLISGVSNEVVLRELNTCDLVIDQVYADLPMSGLAIEASCFNKPVVLAGYGLNKLKDVVGKDNYPPTIICLPEQLEEILTDLIYDRDSLAAYGEACFNFVKNRWNPSVVAANYLELLSGDFIAKEWWHDPKSFQYYHGYGLSENCSKEIIRNILRTKGIEALSVSHRPDLERGFHNYAMNE